MGNKQASPEHNDKNISSTASSTNTNLGSFSMVVPESNITQHARPRSRGSSMLTNIRRVRVGTLKERFNLRTSVVLPHSVNFDSEGILERLRKMWSMAAEFGMESNPFEIYLDEMVSDRFVLLSGMQVLRDELHMAFHNCTPCGFNHGEEEDDHDESSVCHADLSIPSVVSTLAHTNCGDRVDMPAVSIYESMVASRFSSITELGETKPERFNPTGGGTDDGKTLAAVTIAHTLDSRLRRKLYDGNSKSFVLLNFDIKAHCGKLSLVHGTEIQDGKDTFSDLQVFYGKCRESLWRDSRSACGAIVGCLRSYDPENQVHVRIRRDLGEGNFDYLSNNQVLAKPTGVPVTFLVAAAIVAIQGMIDTAKACSALLDERSVAHLTASVTINSASLDMIGTPDHIIYLARSTVFGKEIRFQGLGTDAQKYDAIMANNMVTLMYEGHNIDGFPLLYLDENVIGNSNVPP